MVTSNSEFEIFPRANGTEEAAAELTESELRILADCESAIKEGLQNLVRVAQSLQRIRDQRLYRSTHRTFEDYCTEKWAICRSYAYRLIDCAVVLSDLSTIVDKQLPTTESQFRELKRVDSGVRPDVWQRVIATVENGPITARKIREVVMEVTADTAKSERPKRHLKPNLIVQDAIDQIQELREELEQDPSIPRALTVLEEIERALQGMLAKRF